MAIILQPFRLDLPGFDDLLTESRTEGHRMLERLQEAWANGRNRFKSAGEFMNAAFIGGQLVGVGGRSRDPYFPSRNYGRVRHVYVAGNARRLGAGKALVARTLIDDAQAFEAINTRAPKAAFAFYESLGFVPVASDDHVTHRYDLSIRR